MAFGGGSMVPGYVRGGTRVPQTTPGEAGEGGCIQNAYGGHRTLNLELRTSNLEKPSKAVPSHPQATLRPSGSQPVGTLRLPRGYPEATLRLPRGYPDATPRLHSGSTQAPGKAAQSHILAKAEMLKAEMLKPESAHQCDLKATGSEEH